MYAFTEKNRKEYKHIFTHIRWEMRTFLVDSEDMELPFEVYSIEEIEEKISLPTAFKQCLGILKE